MRYNLVIIYGGKASESMISIDSARNFIQYIDTSKFNIYSVFLDSIDQFWFEKKICTFCNRSEGPCLLVENREILIDYIFPIIHGKDLEGGQLQGYFLSLGFKNVISNSIISSSCSFDKIISKQFVQSYNIKVVPYIDYYYNPLSYNEIVDLLGSSSLFLKPSDNGSSFGCYKISNQNEFHSSLFKVSQISNYPLIEKYMEVDEYSCSVLFNEVSDVIKINYDASFFSYDIKSGDSLYGFSYLKNVNLIQNIQQISLSLFRAMRLNFMARFDFFICKHTGQVYFNEVNSLPGLGPHSLFFASFSAKYSAQELVCKILNSWIEKNHETC